eukprot:jgi/Mesvir1/2143/Mv16664-RA.1
MAACKVATTTAIGAAFSCHASQSAKFAQGHHIRPVPAASLQHAKSFATGNGGQHFRLFSSSGKNISYLRKRIICAPLAAAGEEGSAATVDKRTPEELAEDARYVESVKEGLRLLKAKRDMVFNEVKLTMWIEDPREAERRSRLGIESETGCSRDDIVRALEEVNSGAPPVDRVALRVLAQEIRAWPGLWEEDERLSSDAGSADYAGAAGMTMSPEARRQEANLRAAAERRRAREEAERNRSARYDPELDDLTEDAPPPDEMPATPGWFGVSVLYLVSALPVLIGVGAVLILFVNSLQ